MNDAAISISTVPPVASSWKQALAARLVPLVADGRGRVPARADELAWTAFALSGVHGHREAAVAAASSLAGFQKEDGRVIVQEGLDASWWPTSAAVLAWKAVGGNEDRIASAASFLVASQGLPVAPGHADEEGHDTTIPGWSWIEGTHSWVDPTAMAMLALRAAGREGRERVADGRRLLLDRQLPSGGWNMGNTVAFATELRPAAESTALALTALAGLVDEAAVSRSLELCVAGLDSAATPLTLAWSCFATVAWGRGIDDLEGRLVRCLARESMIGSYDPSLLGLLLVVSNTGGDLLGAVGAA